MKTGKKENPKPLVDKVAEAKPVEDAVGKITEKAPVVTDTSPPPQPKVEEKPVEKKPDPPKPVAEKPKEEPKPEKKPDPPKVDPIAEALKKEEKKPPPKPVAQAAKPPEPAKPKTERPFDQSKIAALLDKRDPIAPGGGRRHAEFQRRPWPRTGQVRGQFRDLGRDVQGSGPSLLEEALWRHRRAKVRGRVQHQAEKGRHA